MSTMEESRPDSLSDGELGAESTEQQASLSATYEDEVVWDANGERLGRVTKCFIEDGVLDRCQLTLDDNLRRALSVEQDVTTIEAGWVTDLRDDGLHIAKAAQQILTPRRGVDTGAGGSDTFPRSER